MFFTLLHIHIHLEDFKNAEAYREVEIIEAVNSFVHLFANE